MHTPLYCVTGLILVIAEHQACNPATSMEGFTHKVSIFVVGIFSVFSTLKEEKRLLSNLAIIVRGI